MDEYDNTKQYKNSNCWGKTNILLLAFEAIWILKNISKQVDGDNGSHVTIVV